MLEPLKILIVEDEALLAMELETLIEDAGHQVVGWATSLAEAKTAIEEVEADLAFVDIHLSDGPTGVDVAKYIDERNHPIVVFMTANPLRIPQSFVGAVGVIAKPYTMNGVTQALAYLQEGVRKPPPAATLPVGFTLSPAFADRWAT